MFWYKDLPTTGFTNGEWVENNSSSVYYTSLPHLSSFVNANKGIDYRLGNTWMYSSALSDSINFNLNAEGHYTSGNNPYFSTAGAGFALDLNHNFIYCRFNICVYY